MKQTLEIDMVTRSEMSDEEILDDIQSNFATVTSIDGMIADIENIFYKTNDRKSGTILIPLKGFIKKDYIKHKIVEVIELRGADIAINKIADSQFCVHGECNSIVVKDDYSSVSESDYKKGFLKTIKDGSVNSDMLRKIYYYILMSWSSYYREAWKTIKQQETSDVDKMTAYYVRLLGSFE
ncbi:hypothetical protein [Sulfurimonas sp.]